MTVTPTYDLFISHAFEDKNAFANDLALELTKAGLKVWYSGFELKLGDSIAGSINKALKNATFGIVVISPVYLKKRWAMNELNALLAQEAEQNRILPILHTITIDEIKVDFPILADRYAISSDQGMDLVVKKVLQVMARAGKVQQEGLPRPQQREKLSKGESGTAHKERINSTAEKDRNTASRKQPETSDTSGGKAVIVIIMIFIAIALYFLYENSVLSTPGVNKEHSTPSNAN